MAKILQLYDQKFGEGGAFMVVRSMTYFADADELPDPVKIIPTEWEEVKAFILKTVKEYLNA